LTKNLRVFLTIIVGPKIEEMTDQVKMLQGDIPLYGSTPKIHAGLLEQTGFSNDRAAFCIAEYGGRVNSPEERLASWKKKAQET